MKLWKNGKENGYQWLFSAVLMLVAAGFVIGVAAKNRAVNTVSSAQKRSQNISDERSNSADETKEDAADTSVLTMEQLLEWEEKDDFSKLTYDDFIHYKNCGPNGDDGILSGSLTGDLYLSLEYQGSDYELTVSYDYRDHSIASLSLKNEKTGEQRNIYCREDDDQMSCYVTEIKDLLNHENYLDSYISYDIPKNLTAGECYFDRASYSSGAMCLFLNDENQREGVYGYLETPIWSADGGVTQTYSLNFDSETGTASYLWRYYYGNGRNAEKESSITHLKNGELKRIAGCDGNASVEGIEFHRELDTFGSCEWVQEPEEKKNIKQEKEKLFPKKIWLACIADKEETSGFGYMFFLDADKYAKEDAVKLLRSVHILKDGNLAHQTLRRKVMKTVPTAVQDELEKGRIHYDAPEEE